ncbi:MAG: DnaJ domain-containing protein [Nitrospirae bacterium]|nr:DnaJ domain-containing protein [Nitrospirota bacterium]
MGRFHINDSDEKDLIYNKALEFIGEIRGGISWEKFCASAIQYADAFIDMLNDTKEAVEFLSSKDIEKDYVFKNIRDIFYRLHFNKANNYYLTLAVSRNAAQEEINKRWKELMLIYHPDRNMDNIKYATDCSKKINEAYSILKDKLKRMEYDRKMLSAGQYHKASGRKSYREVKERDYFFSYKIRRLFPKLITSSYIIISASILLIIYFANRPLDFNGEKPVASNMAVISPDNKTLPMESEKKAEMASEDAKISPPEIPKAPEAKKAKRVNLAKKAEENIITQKDGKFHVDTPAPKAELEIKAKEPIEPVQTTAEPKGDAKPKEILEAKEQPQPLDEVHYKISEGLEKAVIKFMSQYIDAYENGNFDVFLSFFSKSATENNKMDYDKIKEAYKRNFTGKQYKYTLKKIQLQAKDDLTIVTGEYNIKKTKGRKKGSPVTGDIIWTLKSEEGNLKIVKIDYDRN